MAEVELAEVRILSVKDDSPDHALPSASAALFGEPQLRRMESEGLKPLMKEKKRKVKKNEKKKVEDFMAYRKTQKVSEMMFSCTPKGEGSLGIEKGWEEKSRPWLRGGRRRGESRGALVWKEISLSSFE